MANTTLHFDDVCVAIGVAVLDRFAEDEYVTIVTVKRDRKDGYWVGDNSDQWNSKESDNG